MHALTAPDSASGAFSPSRSRTSASDAQASLTAMMSFSIGRWRERALAHSVASTGVMCGDFHIHAMYSADSSDPVVYKVKGAIADGLDIPISSEHAWVTDFQPEVVKLGRGRMTEGQEDMFTILRLSGESLAAKIQLTQIRASRLRERVNLHLALGGDFKGTGMPAK